MLPAYLPRSVGITGLEGMKQINMKILSYGKLKGTAVYIRRIVQCNGLLIVGSILSITMFPVIQ